MELKTAKVKDLKPHPQNPRVHPDSALEKLQRSIQEFGWTNPILVSADGMVLAGHARLKAAQAAGIEEVPVIYLPLEGAKAEAYMIADNKLQDETGWDFPALKDLLEQLDTGEFDIEITGFDSKEIEELMAQFHVPQQGLTDDDEIPEQVETICKRGDLWQLGNHRLLCGDATKKEDVERLMEGEKADMIFTDPPYGIDVDTDWSSAKGGLDFVRGRHTQLAGNKYDKVIGDKTAFDPTFIIKGFDCKEIFLWGADYYYGFLPSGGLFVWDKRLEESADKMFGSCFELCWSKASHKRQIVRVKWAGIFGTEKEPDKNKGRVHPTQKPVELSVWFLEQYSKLNQSVLDLFGGSGSTLMACEKLGRRCFMMEIDEHYCDVIIQRWQNFTGKQAVKR